MKKAELTPDQVKANEAYTEKLKSLRMKYGHVECVKAEIYNDQGESEIVEAWFKRPNLQVLDVISSLKDAELEQQVNVLFKECWIEGDNRIKERDYVKLDAFRTLNKFLKTSVASVKKPFALGL